MERGKLEGVITNLELADHRITQSIEKIKDEEIKKTLSE
jgi:hypothetical protein